MIFEGVKFNNGAHNQKHVQEQKMLTICLNSKVMYLVALIYLALKVVALHSF